MGNARNNKYVPFQINYITEPMNGYTAFNKSTVPCYMAVDVSPFHWLFMNYVISRNFFVNLSI